MRRVCGKYVILSPHTFIKDACIEYDSRIRDVYPEDPLPREFKDIVITHGLASSHTHLGLYPVRHTLATGLRLDDWVRGYAWPWEKLVIDNPELSYHTSLLALSELVKSGVTAVADMHFNEDRVMRAALDTGVRVDLSVAIMSRGVFQDINEPLNQNAKLVRQASLPDIRDWVKVRYGPCTPRLLTPEEYSEVVSKAVEDNVGIHTHLAEVPEDEVYLLRNYGLTLNEFLDYVGLRRVNAIIAHSIWVQGAINELASWNVTLVHSPRSNTLLRDGVMPLNSLLSKGGRVALGVDVAPTYSIVDDASFSIGLHYYGGSSITPEDALSLCLTGYKSMGFGTGLIEKGEVADITLWEVSESIIEGLSLSSPAATIIFGTARVKDVIVGGNYVVKEGEVVKLGDKIAKAEDVVREYISLWLKTLSNSP